MNQIHQILHPAFRGSQSVSRGSSWKEIQTAAEILLYFRTDTQNPRQTISTVVSQATASGNFLNKFRNRCSNIRQMSPPSVFESTSTNSDTDMFRHGAQQNCHNILCLWHTICDIVQCKMVAINLLKGKNVAAASGNQWTLAGYLTLYA